MPEPTALKSLGSQATPMLPSHWMAAPAFSAKVRASSGRPPFDGRLAAGGDRDGAGRNDGVSAHEGTTLENGDAPCARLKRGDRGGKACAARADDEDVVGILRSAACGVGCGLGLGVDGWRGEERRGGE